MLAEELLDRISLDAVIGRSRRAVRIDVINFIRAHTSIGQGIEHHAMSAAPVIRWQRDVERIAAHAISGQLGNDFRTSLFGVLDIFQNEYAGAFSNDKAVTLGIEG